MPIMPTNRMDVNLMYSSDHMNDIKALACQQFIAADDFIKTQEFKNFVTRMKQSEYHKKVSEAKDSADPSQWDEIPHKVLQEVDLNVCKMTPEDGSKLAQNSGLLLLPRWDTIRRQDQEVFAT